MMKLLVSIVVFIVCINIVKGHSLSKIELKNPSDIVYKVEEDKDTNAVTIVNQKPKQATLREIIYYHIIEKTFGSKEEVPEGPDFDDSRRPFTNGHGYQYLPHDPEDEFEEKITTTPEEVITEVTPKEVTTKALPKDTTITTEIPSKRLKRAAKTPNSEGYSYENLSLEPGFWQNSGRNLSLGPGFWQNSVSGFNEYEDSTTGYHINKPQDQDRYGIQLINDTAQDWNNEDSSASEDESGQSRTSWVPSNRADSGNSESVENSNEEDLSQSNEDLNSTNEDAGISNKVSSESDEGWPFEIESNETSEESIEDLINGDAGYESNEDSHEFDHILSYINDICIDNHNKLPGDIQHLNVFNILKDIFDDITNNNMVSAKPHLVSNKDKDVITGGNNQVGTDIPFINSDTPITTEIVEVPYTNNNIESTTRFNEYTDLTTEDTTSKGTTDITNIVTGTNSINDEVTTGIDISTSIPNTDGNVHETGKETTVTEDTKDDNNNDKPTLIDTNTETKPVQDGDKPDVNKLDVMAELMNNEKFWTFMGDLAGKYLEELIARTGLFIKHEIENQLKEQLQAKEETSKEDNKVPFDSDKVTNVYVFYLNKNSEKVMEQVKNIVKGNNGTNLFIFGIDSIKDDISKDTDDESHVTAAPGADLTDNPSTVFMEETTANILNTEPTTGLVGTITNDLAVTTDKSVINDVTDTNDGGLNEWLGIYRTIATESPLTTVTDKTTTDITDITTINNYIREEITPVTETMITTAENEITVTVTVAESDEVTTETGSVTTSADDTQVVINNTVSVPATESTTEKAEIELTTEKATAVTDSETVTDITANIETTTTNSDIITEITTENDIPITETSENDITTVTSEIVRSTDSQTFTTQSESEVTTDSTITENTLITDENTVPTTETSEILTVNTKAITDIEPTTSSSDNSNNIDVTTVNFNVTEENNVSDEPTTISDNIEVNTEGTNENEETEVNKPDNNEITTEDTSDDGINEVDSTEITTDRDDENVAFKESNTDKDTASNEVDRDDISSEDSTSKLENDTTDVTNSGIDSSEHNEEFNSGHLEGDSDDTTEADSN